MRHAARQFNHSFSSTRHRPPKKKTMIFFCEECGKQYDLEPADLQESKLPFRCSACKEPIPLFSGERECAPGSLLQNNPTKLLVVDDSNLIRGMIRKIFEPCQEIQVVGEAANGLEALALIPELNPDVITLDVNMPIMDGLTTLKHIMIKHPKPTLMFSTLTAEGAPATFDALRYGAVDFLQKPSRLESADLEKQEHAIRDKVVRAAGVKMDAVRLVRAEEPADALPVEPESQCRSLVAVGASDGGYAALMKTIPHLPADLPAAVLAVLYAAPTHVEAFARYLDGLSAVRVARAGGGETIEAGKVYLAAGNEYLTIRYDENLQKHLLHLAPCPFPEHRGAIDRLMFSAAEIMGANAAGIVLSGTGEDGAEGLQEIQRMGGPIFVQTPEGCLHREAPEKAAARCRMNRFTAAEEIGAALQRCFLSDENPVPFST